MKINKLLFTTTLTALALTACSPKGANSDSEIENKVEALLDKMTLEEKLGQMNQLSPWDPNELANKVRNGEIGSILNYMNPEEVNKIQKIAMEESRLGIPLLVSRDVIHGYKTIFPIPLGQAATFNPQIVENGARVAAIEASADGIRWTFAPMIDISRDPRWGRIAESCGEDPCKLAAHPSHSGPSVTPVSRCRNRFQAGKSYSCALPPCRTLCPARCAPTYPLTSRPLPSCRRPNSACGSSPAPRCPGTASCPPSRLYWLRLRLNRSMQPSVTFRPRRAAGSC